MKEAPKEIPTRTWAGIFDFRVEGPTNQRDENHSPDAIGGAYAIGWDDYFQDAKTGEVYCVHASDGVNGGKSTYSHADEQYRETCYRAIVKRTRDQAASGVSEIRISRNERALMDGFIHTGWLDEGQSKEGCEGGFVGHCKGVPVICDLESADDLPARGMERQVTITRWWTNGHPTEVTVGTSLGELLTEAVARRA